MHGAEAQDDRVEIGSREHEIIEEELLLLARVQKALADHEIAEIVKTQYDHDLVALRDQISEARLEDVAPLVTEMYRLAALGNRGASARSLPVDAKSPYFGHLVLKNGARQRDVLIGSRGFVHTGTDFAIVDWRHAPVSRIYYRYEEGDEFEESFGGTIRHGEVIARRTLSVQNGELKRITWSEGAVARRGDGLWVRVASGARPMLKGGAGTATRPPTPFEAQKRKDAGKLGVVGDESLREDKRLQAITALIDPAQFAMISKPDSGIVILQGGAGSGKTTVALHRAAFLHFQNPQVFAPKKMVVIVRSPALVEYISRVLPSLGVEGIRVVSLAGWMADTRKKVLPAFERPRIHEIPPAVGRIKKHPAVLALIERRIEAEAEEIAAELEGLTAPGGVRDAVLTKWRGISRLALLPRIREMARWLEGGAARRAGVEPKLKAELLGVLRRSRADYGDVLETWGQVLTDPEALRVALEERSPGQISADEIAELVRYAALQAEEIEVEERDEDDEEERKPRRAKAAAADLWDAIPPMAGREDDDVEDDEDPVLSGLGVDGRHVDDDSPRGKFDEHDDALLLRVVQLKVGGLPLPKSQKSIVIEHAVVDEAQDLSPTDVSVIRGALSPRESMTLAGDTSQKLVFDNSFEDWKGLLADVGIRGVEIEPLRINYRSTREIVDFARHVLGPLADPVEPLAPRSGAEVERFTFGTTGETIAFLAEALRSLVARERKASVAVIARYAAQASAYYDALRNAEVPAIRRVHGKEFSFEAGIDVVDVAQVKGLEYDYVILVEVNASTYGDTIEARHLLHIGATRAVHQLWVTSVGTPSPLLPAESL